MIQLLPFHAQLLNAWKLFLDRWGSAVFLQLLTLIPGVLMLPLVLDYLSVIASGYDPVIVQGSQNVSLFLIGFLLFIFLGVFISTALGILFATPNKLSFGTVIASTIRRYIPVLYTSILSGVIVLLSLIPALALNLWYVLFASKGAPVDGNALVAVDVIVLIAVVALLIPAAIVTAWVMYAPLAVALKAAPAGFTAVMHAKHLVHDHVWQITWRIIGSIVLFRIVTASVSYLPYLWFLVPFSLSIIITAFFVEVYKELHSGQLST